MNKPPRPLFVSSRIWLWIGVAILGAISVAWVLPPASSYRVTIQTPQWVVGL